VELCTCLWFSLKFCVPGQLQIAFRIRIGQSEIMVCCQRSHSATLFPSFLDRSGEGLIKEWSLMRNTAGRFGSELGGKAS
jgi:hypothetical protein